jgi:hypothetical protein
VIRVTATTIEDVAKLVEFCEEHQLEMKIEADETPVERYEPEERRIPFIVEIGERHELYPPLWGSVRRPDSRTRSTDVQEVSTTRAAEVAQVKAE